MDFNYSEEQDALRESIASLLDSYYGDVTKRNAVSETEEGWDAKAWQAIAELGALGLPFSEEDGGFGASAVEVAIVMEEVGRTLTPEPLLDAVYLPGKLIERAGSAEQRKKFLEALSEGGLLLAFAHEEAGSRWPQIKVNTKATGSGTYKISGTKLPVAAGDSAETLVVSAKKDDGTLGLFLVDANASGVTRKVYKTFDERRGAEIVFDNVDAELLGDGSNAEQAIAEGYIAAQAAQCAEAVGVMREALKLTVEYLKTRKQFGVPLATFQALVHRASDMYASLELANSLALLANVSVGDGVYDPIVASRAKLQVGKAAKQIGQEAVQMHGGIGITYEAPISHYHARLTAINHTLGTPDDHLRVLADAVTLD